MTKIRIQSNQRYQFGDTLLTSVVDEQLTIFRTPNRSRLFFLSSGANELDPPPLYRSFLRMEYDKSNLLQCYTNGIGYPPLLKIIETYETFRARKQTAYDLLRSHSAVVTFGAAGAIYGAFSCLARERPLNVLLIDYNYPIFERVVNQLGGKIHQVLPEDPTKPVLAEDAVQAIRRFHPSIVVLCNTSNPTGQSYDVSFLDKIFRAAQHIGSWIVYDRVCEFDVGPDAEFDCLNTALSVGISERLVVINSISKTCSLPGLRLGWAFCPRTLAENIGQWQFHMCENPSMVGMTALMVDLWLRMENMAVKSSGVLEPPNREELDRIYDTDGLIRSEQSRKFFGEIFLSRNMEDISSKHIHHFESQVDIFHHNFDVFKSLLGSKLRKYPLSIKGYNAMVSRDDFESKNPIKITSELIQETGISIVPEACFISSKELVRNQGSYFRLSLATKPSQFKAVCKMFANWSPN